uniref:Reverse transcriptase domain-containing protein n=1 Tax=Tanacetum cinerariifolium TaxID=118510 RepID=A0A6L2LYE9_TANCI|nr:hypothetical protein [Tanacetum cinerariifolium]
MAIFIISISSDSSEESVGTSTARVILFVYFSIFCTNSSDSNTSERPPSQPILVGRPYRTQPNGVLKMWTTKKRVGPLPTHRIALRYSSDYSSSDHFTSDDSSRDSSSKTSLNSHSDTSSDSPLGHSSSGHSISNYPYDSMTVTFAGPSRKRRRSPTTSVLIASPVPRALSLVRADLLLPRKRIRYSDSVTDFEADIDACFAFADDIEAIRTNARIEVGTTTEEKVESSARGMIGIGFDRVTHPFVRMTRLSLLGRIILILLRPMNLWRTMPTATHSGMTQDAINELIAKRVADALEAYDTARNPETETDIEDISKTTMSRPMALRVIMFIGKKGSNVAFQDSRHSNHYLNEERERQDVCLPILHWTQELTLLCTKMVSKEEDQVKKYIGGLPDNIQGNVIAVEPTRLHDAICIANNLMDQKLKGYAVKYAKNKRRKAYARNLPYRNKCIMHYEGSYIVKCGLTPKTMRNLAFDDQEEEECV